MDEREARALLTRAAESVVGSDDLAARAERRYRMRRVRGRVVSAAVVVCVVAAGVTTAALVGGAHSSAPVVEPTPSSRPTSTSRPPKPSTVDPNAITGMSFVDENVGFGLVYEANNVTSAVARTDDGGRTWVRIGDLAEPEAGVHFENRTDGVAWGTGPLEFTTDGGVHWESSDGPVDNGLAWARGRLWAMTPCVQSTPCGSRPVLISDDAGATWRPTAPLRLGFGGLTLLAVTRDTAYVVEPATDQEGGRSRLARTDDGGASWSYEPVPCPRLTAPASLAFNGDVFVLACIEPPAGIATRTAVFTSTDDGHTWRAAAAFSGETAFVTNVGSTLIANAERPALLVSTDNARTWGRVVFRVTREAYTASLPGVGMWALVDGGLWFTADGAHWEPRARSGS